MKHRAIGRISDFRFHEHGDGLYLHVKIQGGWISFQIDSVNKSTVHNVRLILEYESPDNANP